MDIKDLGTDWEQLAREAVGDIKRFLEANPVGTPGCIALNDELERKRIDRELDELGYIPRVNTTDAKGEPLPPEINRKLDADDKLERDMRSKNSSIPDYSPKRRNAQALLAHAEDVVFHRPNEFQQAIARETSISLAPDPHLLLQRGIELMIERAQPPKPL